MKSIKRIMLSLALSLAAGLALAAYPDKPVKFVVPSPAGGALDTAARIIGERLTAAWGQPVVIENRPGAAGAIGTESVLKSPADGYTVLLHTPMMLSTELTRPTVNYRTLRDFVPVTTIFTTPVFYIGSNETAQGSLKEVLARGNVSYGSHGNGTTTHYMGAWLGKVAQVDMIHVPFAGDTPILTAVLGGHVKTGFLSGAAAKKALESGRVHALAVASGKRTPLIPSVPTFTEQGYPGFERESWAIALVSAGTPKAVIDQLARDIDRVVKAPDVQQRFMELGIPAKGGTPEETLKEVKIDLNYWAKLIQEFGVLSK